MKVINKDQVKLDQIKVLIRLDLNVPLNKGKITDANRIDKIIPTLKFLLNKKAKLILISHVGRPKGKWVKELSLSPICENISLKLNENIRLINKDVFKLNKNEIFKNSNDNLVMLENIRFYKEEEENDPKLAQHLAGLGDIYVNEAFSCSHRAHASVTEITKYLPCYAGIQLNTEVDALKKITSNILKPITFIIGGSKISTKINIIKNLIPKFNNIIFVGGMANNILKFKGFNIGKSIYEENCNDIVKQMFSLAEINKCKIVYPIDAAVGKNLNDTSIFKNPDKIENAVTDKTRCIFVPHTVGIPADMDEIMRVAEKYNLRVIEDCAQAHLAEYKGKLVGTMGEMGCFSLGGKMMTTGHAARSVVITTRHHAGGGPHVGRRVRRRRIECHHS